MRGQRGEPNYRWRDVRPRPRPAGTVRRAGPSRSPDKYRTRNASHPTRLRPEGHTEKRRSGRGVFAAAWQRADQGTFSTVSGSREGGDGQRAQLAVNANPGITLNDGNTIPRLGFGVFQVKRRRTQGAGMGRVGRGQPPLRRPPALPDLQRTLALPQGRGAPPDWHVPRGTEQLAKRKRELRRRSPHKKVPAFAGPSRDPRRLNVRFSRNGTVTPR